MRATARLVFISLLFPVAASAQEKLGPEFIANAGTAYPQGGPSVAMKATGEFVVTWVEPRPGLRLAYVEFRRFDPWGNPTGPDTVIPGSNPGTDPSFPTPLALDPSASFIVAWNRPGDESGAQIVDPSDVVLGGPLTVTGGRPAVATAGAGAFVLAWQNNGPRARRVDLTGAALGPEIATGAPGSGLPVVAGDASGGFMIVWQQLGLGPGFDHLFLQRYSAFGAPLGSEVTVATHTTGFPGHAAIASDAAGNFVVVWRYVSTEGEHGIFAQRYDSTGAALGGNFKVNTSTTLYQWYPSVACDGNGDFLVVWGESPASTLVGPSEVMGRRYDASGNPAGPEFMVNTYTTGRQFYPKVAGSGDGRFVVVWQNDAADDPPDDPFAAPDVFVQMFLDGNLIFKDDFESGTHGAWSATGTTSGSLAVGPNDMPGGGAWSLEATVSAPGGVYVEDRTPADESEYHARFLFDPNGFDPGEGASHFRVRFFLAFGEDRRRFVALVLRRQGGAYSLRGRARLDDGTQADTPFVPIADEPHLVEIAWRRASGPDASDGSFELWIDGTAAAVLPGLDNAARGVDFVRMGALAAKPGAAGSMRWDQFESRRRGTIGP